MLYPGVPASTTSTLADTRACSGAIQAKDAAPRAARRPLQMNAGAPSMKPSAATRADSCVAASALIEA